MTTRIEKPWGYEDILVQTDKFVVKQIYIESGQSLSLQYHVVKSEMIYVLQGACAVFFNDQWATSVEGGYLYIPATEVHRFEAAGAKPTLLLEVSTPELDDVVRLNDKYGRVK
ncbi:hypothetical protein LCGC14_0691970 [marine sediment metagenome]|uniref:Mannose-6-phosphate isomerase type II C-terminal domain-containing protein n=1 Tax=marine sediment metagenome TaxID=412755 RepID=A0A0F9R5F2_9ZZZZ